MEDATTDPRQSKTLTRSMVAGHAQHANNDAPGPNGVRRPIPPGCSYMKVREKIEAIFDHESGVRLKHSPGFDLKKGDCQEALGITAPTRDRILKGDPPTEETIRTIVSNLNAETDIRTPMTFGLLADQTSLEDFCITIGAPLRVADTVSAIYNHPLADVWPLPNATEWEHSKSIFDTLHGLYRFYRIGKDGDGNLGIVQGAIWVRSQVKTSRGIETCCALVTPRIGEDGQFFYSGRVIARGGDYCWIFIAESV